MVTGASVLPPPPLPPRAPPAFHPHSQHHGSSNPCRLARLHGTPSSAQLSMPLTPAFLRYSRRCLQSKTFIAGISRTPTCGRFVIVFFCHPIAPLTTTGHDQNRLRRRSPRSPRAASYWSPRSRPLWPFPIQRSTSFIPYSTRICVPLTPSQNNFPLTTVVAAIDQDRCALIRS